MNRPFTGDRAWGGPGGVGGGRSSDRGVAFRASVAGKFPERKHSGGPAMRKPAQKAISRRKALAFGAGAVAAGAVAAPIFGLANKTGGSDTGLLSWWSQPDSNLALAGTSEWSALVNKDCSMLTEHGKGTSRLLEVQSLPSSGDRPPEV